MPWATYRYLSPVIGYPALTVPTGFTGNGLPVGLEFLGTLLVEVDHRRDVSRDVRLEEISDQHAKPPGPFQASLSALPGYG